MLMRGLLRSRSWWWFRRRSSGCRRGRATGRLWGHSINYDPVPTIASRIGLIKTQFEARVARSIVRGLYQRYRMDPRLVPAAIAAFTAGVRSHFPAAAAQILR